MAHEQPNNPLHGLTLEKILVSLQEFYGWEGLAARLDVRCFTHDPSIKSSLKFLRRTPWARKKLEDLFVYTLEKYGDDEEGDAMDDSVGAVAEVAGKEDKGGEVAAESQPSES